jgi:two-component system response regulator AtoC
MKNEPALVVVADGEIQQYATTWLRDLGYEPVVATSDGSHLGAGDRQFSLTVVHMDSASIDLLNKLRTEGGAVGALVALASGPDQQHDAADWAALGVDEAIHKPFTEETFHSAVARALAKPCSGGSRATPDDMRMRLRQEIGLWRSAKMRDVYDIIQQAARVDVTLLVSGETGTGKDLVARAVHDASARQNGPFVKVNCAAVPRELLESELFGHERGAFTGAHQLKVGKFESADRGTIFLDEIGDLHPALQGKLLHVLQDGNFSRVGGRSPVKVDVRVLAATNQDLEQAVAAGRFREDLYYRLNVIQIVVPPLRERAEEIPVLADYFMQRYSALFRRERLALSAETMARLMRYRFPGNVRELENMVKRMIVLGDPFLRRTPLPGPLAGSEEPGPVRATKAAPASLKDIGKRAAQMAEREAILQALEQTHWNRVRAAKLLAISYRALLYKIKDAGLDRDRQAAHRV